MITEVNSILNIEKEDNPFRHYYVYKEDNLLGYVIIDLIYDKMEVVDILVYEKYRNKKIGSKLLEFITNLARKEMCYNITLEVKADNEIAINLYKKYGFKKIATRTLYYEDQDGLLMELIL